MARWTPCRRSTFIRKLERLGFSLPEPGGRHFYMRYGRRKITIPNNAEYSVPQLRMLLEQVALVLGREITLAEWQRL